MGWMLLFTAAQIAASAIGVWVRQHTTYSLALFRAMLALLAIGFLLLCETILILVGEHFNSVPDYYGRRHRTFVHLLSGILLGAFIAAVCYASWVYTMELPRCILAYIVLLFIFLCLLLLHQMLRTPHLTHYPTTVFLFVLNVILLTPVIYLALRHRSDEAWSRRSSTAFYVLWVLPEAVVTIALLALPLYYWYPEYRSAWIY